EVVTPRVVDPPVLDVDRPRLLERVEDHALPNEEPSQGDDERGDAYEGHDRSLGQPDRRADGDRGGHCHEPATGYHVAAAGKHELGGDEGADSGDIADREVDLAEE